MLIADALEESAVDSLLAGGCQVVFQPDLTGEALGTAIRQERPDVLVVRAAQVTKRMLEGSTIGLVIRAGAGLNSIDVKGAEALGIDVANCPGLNAIAVAELTLGLVIALDRRIPDNVNELRAGRWNKREFSRARGLHGRALGLLGYGQIAQEVAHRARAFGMEVLAWSRRFATQRGAGAGASDGVTIVGSPIELAERSDVLSVHLALTPETRSFVDRRILSRLRSGASLVNTARGEVIDQDALADAIRTRGLKVAVDVWADEPAQSHGTFHDPLIALPGVIGTHHIGASTDQAQQAIAQEVVRLIQHWRRNDHNHPHS